MGSIWGVERETQNVCLNSLDIWGETAFAEFTKSDVEVRVKDNHLKQAQPMEPQQVIRTMAAALSASYVTALSILSALLLFLASTSYADEASTEKLSQEIAGLLTFGYENTAVTISECTLRIETHLRETCRIPTEPNWSRTIIDFREVRSLESATFQGGFIVRFELDVPEPSHLKTALNRLRLGDEAAFAIFSEESAKLLEESKHVSGKSLTYCTGKRSFRKQRSLALILDSQLERVAQLEALVAQCQN